MTVQHVRHTSDWMEVITLSFVYALYLLIATSPLGLLISLYKLYHFKHAVEKGGEQPSPEEVLIATHHEWLIRTFFMMFIFVGISVGSLYYGIGYIILTAAVIWWYYRVIRGIGALISHHEMTAPICTKIQCYNQPTEE